MNLKIETYRARYAKLLGLDPRMKKAIARVIELAKFDCTKMKPVHYYLVARFAAVRLGHDDPFAVTARSAETAWKKLIRLPGVDGIEVRDRVKSTLKKFGWKPGEAVTPSHSLVTSLLVVEAPSIR